MKYNMRPQLNSLLLPPVILVWVQAVKKMVILPFIPKNLFHNCITEKKKYVYFQVS